VYDILSNSQPEPDDALNYSSDFTNKSSTALDMRKSERNIGKAKMNNFRDDKLIFATFDLKNKQKIYQTIQVRKSTEINCNVLVQADESPPTQKLLENFCRSVSLVKANKKIKSVERPVEKSKSM